MAISYKSLEDTLSLNLFNCPLMDGFMNTLSVRLASAEILITNEAERGNRQEAITVAREAIRDNCLHCISKDVHEPTADAVQPRIKPRDYLGQYDPTIIIHTI